MLTIMDHLSPLKTAPNGLVFLCYILCHSVTISSVAVKSVKSACWYAFTIHLLTLSLNSFFFANAITHMVQFL